MTVTDQTSPELNPQLPSAAGEWGLFVDWCAATDHTALPAHPDTVHVFLTGCPAAPATHARRLTAVAAAHRAAGYPPPTRTGPVRDLARGRATHPGRAAFDSDRVDAALRALPVHGWTGGWFGRRDRALLVLAAAGLSYPAVAGLTAADITITGGTATVAGRQPVNIAGGDDPTVCRACALASWIHARDLDVDRGTRALTDALKKTPELTGNSTHRCRRTRPIAERTRTAVLLPPIDQHGYTTYTADLPLTPRSISELARDTAAGKVTAHRAVPDTGLDVAEPSQQDEPRAVPGRVFTAADWRHGVDARNRARTGARTPC